MPTSAPTSEKKKAAKKRYARTKLREDQRIRMFVECGGRCALCNEYLLEGGLSFREVTFGELAHIIGLQPNEHSPRGLDEDLDGAQRNDPENLMLVCERDHNEIDKSGSRDMFPTDWLRQRKADHIARIHFLTGLSPQHPTVPLRVIATVRGDVVEVDRDAVANAVMLSAMRYPKFRLSGRNAIEIDLRGLPGEADAKESYYEAARTRIDEVFDHTLATGWANDDIRHLSVFAFARIPILVYLGTKLGDHTPVDIYQRDRVHQDWIWPAKDGELDFTVEVPATNTAPTEAILIVNVSGTIEPTELPAELADLPVLTLTAADRHPNVIDSPTKLADFTRACHQLIGQLEANGYKSVDRLHVFAATGVACSVELGRVFDDDVHPTLAIYDRQSGTGYQLGMEVGHRQPPPPSPSGATR